jgi:Domain of unknown function (DUF4338)
VTDIRLLELWRYFRYTWSLEYRSAPARQLPLLVRNAARPGHPIIGIALLASPVIRTRPRDKWIGWTFETFVQKLSTGDWNAKSALKAMALRTEIHAAARRRTIREFGQGAGLLPQRRLPDRRLCGACLGSSCLFFPLSEIPPLSGAGTLRALLRHLCRYVLPTRT